MPRPGGRRAGDRRVGSVGRQTPALPRYGRRAGRGWDGRRSSGPARPGNASGRLRAAEAVERAPAGDLERRRQGAEPPEAGADSHGLHGRRHRRERNLRRQEAAQGPLRRDAAGGGPAERQRAEPHVGCDAHGPVHAPAHRRVGRVSPVVAAVGGCAQPHPVAFVRAPAPRRAIRGQRAGRVVAGREADESLRGCPRASGGRTVRPRVRDRRRAGLRPTRPSTTRPHPR